MAIVSVSLNPFLPMKAGTLFNGKFLMYLSSDSLSSTISTSNLRNLTKPTVTNALGVNVHTYRVFDIAHELTSYSRWRSRVEGKLRRGEKFFSSNVERKNVPKLVGPRDFVTRNSFRTYFFFKQMKLGLVSTSRVNESCQHGFHHNNRLVLTCYRIE